MACLLDYSGSVCVNETACYPLIIFSSCLNGTFPSFDDYKDDGGGDGEKID